MHRRVKSYTVPDPIRAPAGAEPQRVPRALTEADAIDIWIAKWLRVRRRDLCARYACDPRRLYEVWTQERFPAAREKARAIFSERYPTLVDRIDYSRHRRISRNEHPDQLALFE